MGLLKLLEATVKTVTLPVTAVVDFIDPDTSMLLDFDKSRTGKMVEKIAEDIDDIAE